MLNEIIILFVGMPFKNNETIIKIVELKAKIYIFLNYSEQFLSIVVPIR